jgi:hypothetical protein
MNHLSCDQIQEKIDLYAAGECDHEEALEIERHLAGCPTCPSALEESRQMLSLLDLHLGAPDQMARLKVRLDEERHRARFLHARSATRSVLALAAMLLAMLGLALSLGVFSSPEYEGHHLVAFLEPGRQLERSALPPALVQEMIERKGVPLQLHMSDIKAVAGEHPSPPPEVNLALSIHNAGPGVMRLLVAGPYVEVRLILSGPGVARRPAPPEAPEQSNYVDLKPGETHRMVIRRLEDGPPDAKRYWYLSRPGRYTLMAILTTAVSPPPPGSRVVLVDGREFGLIAVRSSLFTIQVSEQ